MNTPWIKTSLLIVLPVALFACLGYLVPRSAFVLSITIYTLLFGWYYIAYHQSLTWRQILWLGIVLRLVFLVAEPSLSDDFWRYLWDGHLWIRGVNPYSILPNELTELDSIQVPMLENMNSPGLYSIYPPITQSIFALIAYLSGGILWLALLWFHVLVVLVEWIIMFLIKNLWCNHNLNALKLYAFNPLIIIELSGNVHTEFLCLLSIVLIFWSLNNRHHLGKIGAFTMAIGVKIIPLLFIPILFVDRRKWLVASFELIAILFLIWIAMYSSGIIMYWDRFSTAFLYYFQQFEFNALNVLFRDLFIPVKYWRIWEYQPLIEGFFPSEMVLKWDLVHVFKWVCKSLELILFAALTYSLIIQKKISTSFYMYAMYVVYILFTDSLHPWYLCPLIVLGLPLKMKAPIVWSYVIFLTYCTYMNEVYQQSYLLQLIEYIVVGFAMYLDWKAYRNKSKLIVN